MTEQSNSPEAEPSSPTEAQRPPSQRSPVEQIAIRLNRSLQNQRMTARVKLQEAVIQVLIEADNEPSLTVVLPLVQRELEALGKAGLKTAQIYGRKAGERMPAWSQTLELRSAQSHNDLKEQAKAGDLTALATIINQAIAHKRTTATVSLEQQTLQILLKSTQVPEQNALTILIERQLATLQSRFFHQVTLYGLKTGEEIPGWNHTFEYSFPPASVPPTITSTSSPLLASNKRIAADSLIPSSPATTTPTNAYTDAPKQHRNLLLGSLQLLFWLFFHPAAWRNHIARIDPTLRPDFWVVELGQNQWKNPALRRLLVQVYLILPLLLGSLNGLGLWIAGLPGKYLAIVIATGVAANLTGSVVIGIPVGVGFSLVGSTGFIVMFGLTNGISILLFGMVGSLAVGLASSLIGNIVNQKETRSQTQQIGGIIVGILLVGVVIHLVGIVLFGLVGGAAGVVLFGAVVGVAIGIRTRQRIRGLLFGLLFGLVFGIASSLVDGEVFSLVNGVTIGVAGGIVFSALFGLPYAMTEQIAGSWAGAIAGAILCVVSWLLICLLIPHPPLYTLFICFSSLIGLAGGLTLSRWRPVLFYPFTALLNTLLYHLDKQRTDRPFSFLRYHSAFWDEQQRLPLLGLDSHVVLVAERHPTEGRAAIAYLSTSHQKWAAQTAQIELNARQLERCQDAFAVGQSHRMVLGELEKPVEEWFRRFNRISEDVEAALNQSNGNDQRLLLNDVADRLEGLLRELTVLSDKYAVRFRPIAQHWSRILTSHLNELAVLQ